MFTALIIIYLLFLGALAWRNFRLALGLLIVTLPTYLIRFTIPTPAFLVARHIPGLPTTLLELSFTVIFLVWLIRYARQDIKEEVFKFVKLNKIFTTFFLLFFAASVVGIFTSDMWWYSLGQWRAYFFEPMLVFIMIVGHTQDKWLPSNLPWFLGFSSISVGLVAVIQKFSGALYPPSLWNDQLFGRVTSFFTSANALGLYLGPLILIIIALIIKRLKKNNYNFKSLFSPLYLVLTGALIASLLALLFSKSVGAWVAVSISILIFLFLIGYKKTIVGLIVLGIIIAALPPAQRLLASKNKSGSNRLVLWGYTQNFLLKNPQNFTFGGGVGQFFRKVQKPYYDQKKMERLIYPHNIFLNFWTEIGLLGLLAFLGLYYFLLSSSFSIYKNKDTIVGAGLLAALVVIFLHGLIDVPYFKNDLAMMFWIIAATVMCVKQNKN